MDTNTEERVRALAQPLWESAARPYGVAMDFWLMAEQMVLEVVATASRFQATALGNGDVSPSGADVPGPMPVAKVRELAECMWESAGRQYGMAQDFWLAAERHVLAVIRAATNAAEDKEMNRWAKELSSLPANAYLERIRLLAYCSWETAGRNYGQALDNWLKAEQEFLGMMSRSGRPETETQRLLSD